MLAALPPHRLVRVRPSEGPNRRPPATVPSCDGRNEGVWPEGNGQRRAGALTSGLAEGLQCRKAENLEPSQPNAIAMGRPRKQE